MFPLRTLAAAAFAAAIVGPTAAITLTVPASPVSENFDSLGPVSGGTLPSGWEFSESGSSANTTYSAGNGSSSTGNTYSFGATGATDRALGSIRTSSLAAMYGTVITNQTALTLTGIEIEFMGEQWRLGATGRADRLDFAYSLDATSLLTGNWVDFDVLDFISPITVGTAGALDGNLAENRTLVADAISGLTLAPGASLWIRWSDFDASSSDDGLAIDDFSVRGVAGAVATVPERLPDGVIVALVAALLMAGLRGRVAPAHAGGSS
jgi:hypothetical protein